MHIHELLNDWVPSTRATRKGVKRHALEVGAGVDDQLCRTLAVDTPNSL
jgi:hypothetical protein